MARNKIELRTGIIIGIIVVAALSRLLPHPINFTPIAGIGLFGAAYFSKKHLAFLIPFAAMWISDLIINNIYYPILFPQYYEGFTLFTSGWYWMYGAFALIILLGFKTLKKVKPLTLLGSSLLASVIFFLITNFGSWMIGIGTYYSGDAAGLMTAYAAGIPYFWNTIAGDLFYIAVMFGSFEWLKSRYPALSASHAG